MEKLLYSTLILAFCVIPKLVYAQNFEFPVEHERLLKNHRGKLVITPVEIQYKTTRMSESRSWQYKEIQQVKIISPTVIEILTYEDEWRELGRDRNFKFRLLEGKITPEISALLMSKATQVVATSVAPITGGELKFNIDVKHLHTFGGCEGALKIYSDHIIYESASEPTHTRYWRYSDIQSFSHTMRSRFDISTFEKKLGGPTKVYGFQLKEELSAFAYDYIWVRVNPDKLYPYEKAASQDRLSATYPVGEDKQPKSAKPESNSSDSQLVISPVVEDRSVVMSAEEKPQEKARMQRSKPHTQTARIILTERGYTPNSIRLLQGVPTQITFIRKAKETCGTEIILPAQSIQRALPLNKPVVVAFTPTRSGEIIFTCGMGMLRGKIVVHEK